MIVKTTTIFDNARRGFCAQGFCFPNHAYFNHIHRVLNQDQTAYESETNYRISKNEEANIPDEVINTPEFQELFTLGYVEEVT